MSQKSIQLFSEALIPLLGFFLWDWGLYFILLFYIIDLFANEFVIHLKSRKTTDFQLEKSNKLTWVKNGLISLFLIVVVIVLIHVVMRSIDPSIDFKQQAQNFWNYTELGIKQGYVLFPLLFFVGYQQYKMQFLARAKYIIGVIYNVKNVEIIIPPKIVAPTANLDVSPAPGPIFPITSGNIAIIVLIEVIMIGLNLRSQASLIANSIFFPLVLN